MESPSLPPTCDGYKVFDENWQCHDFQFEVGKTYSIDGPLQMCENGFHFCQKLVDCFEWKDFNPKNKIAKVRASGKIIHEEIKSVCEMIEILEEISWKTMLTKVNSGSGNSGHSNSGDCNSGHSNSGNWNSCNKETGFFNSQSPQTIRVFNKPCPLDVWENAAKPGFLYFNMTQWIDFKNMTDDEKTHHPHAETCGGYLKHLGYKQAFQDAYAKASDDDKALLLKLPNFDADVFYEISGIDLRKK